MTRFFGAPRTLVFEAWTQPQHVSRWWDPIGTPLQACEIDLRPGGRFRFVNPSSSGGHEFTGVYQEIAPPERLVMRVDLAVGRSATSTLLFTDQGTCTGFAMTIDCALPEDRDSLLAMRVDEGTGRTLANLDRLVRSLQGGAA
ncbi:SRPBCC domain-containing protein [Ramlibacter sp.]|uniref:SRPBCC domain-containing protein n=1 Tax=Ramlibacter sp. TaxID=1917967 RepID=UPI002606D642|nr:SRPBCC domain-containing protein [Ramlibacter sp.]